MDKFNANESVDTARLEKLFLESGTLKILRKNEYMVRQNDKTNHIGFVTSGIFRLTRIDTNGNEWIVGCSFENDFVCDYPSLINRADATVSIQATTDCEVYLLPLSELNQFWETDMETQRLGRRIAETMFAEIYQRNNNGYTYLDVLISATKLGMKCLLWYGFMTINDKQALNKYVSEKLNKAGIKDYMCSELIMNSIEKDTVICNPGILGSGILATNLSQKSNVAILNYSKRLVEIYKNARYKEFDGSLHNDTISKKQNIKIKRHL